MKGVTSIDKDTNALVLRPVKWDIPKCDIGDLVKIKAKDKPFMIVKVVEVHFACIQEGTNIKTDIFYVDDNDNMFDEDAILQILTAK